jgi:hypothetical protein
MDEQTTTAPATTDAGTDTTVLPADGQTTAAATQATDNTTTTTGVSDTGGDKPVPQSDDDKLAKYAESHGITLDSDGARKAAKIAMDNQAEYQRSQQKASELSKALGSDKPAAPANQLDIPEELLNHPALAALVDEVKTLRGGLTNMSTASQVSSFFQSTPDAKELEPAMAEIVTNNPVIGELVKGGHMSVEQLYHMARGSNPDALKKQGGKEALEQLADKQQAKAVRGSATSSAFSSGKEDAFLKGFNSPY